MFADITRAEVTLEIDVAARQAQQPRFRKRAQKGDADGQRVLLVLDPDTYEYETPQKPRFESVGAVRNIEDLGQRLRVLFAESWQADRAARYVWAVISYELAYAAATAPEIANDLKSIDETMRWGFNFEAGPFQLWDQLGVAETVVSMGARSSPTGT